MRHLIRPSFTAALLIFMTVACREAGSGTLESDLTPVVTAPVDVPLEAECVASVTRIQEGWASNYGQPHHGRRTANGERFDMNALTAAHRTLPMGSRIRVTNLANGKIIELRINDRGPYAKKRVLDVSRYAAHELDFTRRGVTKVRIETLAPCTTKPVERMAGDPPTAPVALR